MGALLIAGLFLRPTDTEVSVEPVVIEEPVEVVEPITILPQETLELLDPEYSEKGVYQDRTIRVAFNASYSEEGIESRLPFWIHNVSGEVINVLWDRCSLQLPGGNTVSIVNEQNVTYLGMPVGAISIAPEGDLFDAVIPVSEVTWTDEGWSLSHSVLDQGMFTFVLAIERSARCPAIGAHEGRGPREEIAAPTGCEPEPLGRAIGMKGCTGREIVYDTCRFIVR